MTDIHRFSSRRQRLDHAFLAQKLAGAKSYRRIAGYFRSSIFELVGEEIASIPLVQVVCNSELDAADVLMSQLGLPDQMFFTDRGFGSLGFLEQQAISQALAPGFLREHNPIVRHTVLRKRVTLEDAGLLRRELLEEGEHAGGRRRTQCTHGAGGGLPANDRPGAIAPRGARPQHGSSQILPHRTPQRRQDMA